MAVTLPDYNALGRRPVPRGQRAFAQQDTASAGMALAQVGQTVGRVGDELYRQQQEAENTKQRAAAGLALAKLNNDLHEAHDEVSRGLSDGSLPTGKASETFSARSAALRTSALEGLSEPQRSLIGNNVESTIGGLNRSLANNVFKRGQLDVAGVIDQFGEQAQRDVPRIGPGMASEKFSAFVDFNGDAAGLTEPSKQKLKQAFKENASFYHLQGVGADAYKAGSIAGIEEARKQVKASDVLDPAKKTQLDNQLFVYKNTLEAEAERLVRADQVAADKRLKVAESAAQELSKFVASGAAPDAEYQIRVMNETQGTPFAQGAKAMLEIASKGAGFGSLPLASQDAALRAAEAAASKGTSPEAAAALQYARTVNQTQKQAYKEDPWAAGARFQRLPPVDEAPIGSAADGVRVINDRLPLMPSYEFAAGTGISPLRPSEATAWGQRLAALPPDQAAEALGQAGERLGAPQITAMADQLDKSNDALSLSLMLGTDRTTAGRTVSALVLRGHAAIKDKTIRRDETALTGWKSEIAKMIDGTLGDREAETKAKQAAYYVRAAMEVEGGQAPGFDRFSDASNVGAVAMVMGQPVERGGTKTFLPRGMKEAEFNDKAQASLAPLAGKTLYVRGQPVTAESLASRLTEYGLTRDGQGIYTPVRNGALVTLDPQGQQPLKMKVF